MTQVETPGSYSLLHGLICPKYRLDPNDTSHKWHLLNDGRLLKDEDNVVIENDRFCIENFQNDKYPHGKLSKTGHYKNVKMRSLSKDDFSLQNAFHLLN